MPTYNTHNIRFGLGGLNLTKAHDLLAPSENLRLKNVQQNLMGGWTSRPGMDPFAYYLTGTTVHSIGRLNDPQADTWTRIFGVDTVLCYGQVSSLTLAETGFSGDPLSLVPYRSPFSGQAWMYVGDRSKMRKIRVDGLDLPIGLPAPSAPTTALGTLRTTAIENFETGFTALAGTGAAPTLSYPASKDSNGLNILTAFGAATTAYYNMASKALAVNLSDLAPGGIPSTDDDFIHLWMKVDNPQKLQEVMIYLVSSAFSVGSASPPGTIATQNTDSFMKSFAPSEFTSVLEQVTTTVETITDIQSGYTIQMGLDQLGDNGIVNPDPTTQIISQSFTLGRGAWTEYGTIEVPLRKSDFLPIGENPVWGQITGIVVVVRVSDPAIALNVTLDHMYLRGGAGLDSADPATPYDYRVTNYDTRTGDESNPSAEQAAAAHLETLRQEISIDPAAYGDANIRQKIYRRGGTLTNDWYYVGTNSGDGTAFTDTLSDTAIAAAGVLETDNDQPISTVNTSGVTVLAQPVPYVWGPAYNLLFACGDPYRPGYVYWCKPGRPDAWPSENAAEVCSTSEELMNGCILGGQSYVFSREKMYVLISNIVSDGSITPQPTACTEGLISPWGICTGAGAIWFVAATGIYMTTGGPAVNITDNFLRPLFNNQESGDFEPINFNLPLAMRLCFFNNELYFSYDDTDGDIQTLVYGLLPDTNFWRHYDWSIDVAGFYAETSLQGQPNLLIGSGAGGRAFIHQGNTDDGSPIACTVQTGYETLDMGRRHKTYAGDLALYAEGNNENVTITPYFDAGRTIGSSVIKQPSLVGVYHYDLFPSSNRARSLSLYIEWTSSTGGPSIYWASYPWAPDPIDHIRWDTDWLDHGLSGWQVPIYGELTLISTAQVTLTVTAKSYTSTVSTKTYRFDSTAGVKQKYRLDFEAQRGVEFRYVFTCSVPFQIFWEESVIFVQQWGSLGALTKFVLGAEVGGPTDVGINPAARASIAGGG